MRTASDILAILPYTRNAELLAQILSFLAITSIMVWLIVLFSTVARLALRRSNRRNQNLDEPPS